MDHEPESADRPDPYRVDPARHRGRDMGILARWFKLPWNRRDDDHRGPRRINPGGDRGQQR